MREALFAAMYEFVSKASEIARAEQLKLHTTVKPDASYVTNVDLQLSRLAFTILSTIIPEEYIITEEHPERLHRLILEDEPSTPEILVVVDPIDGTRNYVHQMPLYGISIGVLRYLKPWLGVVGFPGLYEVVYFDGEDLGVVDCRTKHGPPRILRRDRAGAVPLDQNAIVLTSHTFVKQHSWDHNTCELSVIGCATINLCWPALGRGLGAVFGAGLWDLAGSWPILESAGLRLWSINGGSPLERFRWSDFDPETLKLREPVLACRPEHFARLSGSIILGASGNNTGPVL